MEKNKISSNIELINGEVISLILDGSIPCIILHPSDKIADYINNVVRPIKYSLLKKGFYVKSFPRPGAAAFAGLVGTAQRITANK